VKRIHVEQESPDFSSLVFVEPLFVFMLSLPRETFFSATGTRPIIKLLYKVSSGTMINHKHIMTCKKK